MAPSQAAVVVDSPLLAPEVSTPADVTPAVVTKSSTSAAKTKTEGETSKKVQSKTSRIFLKSQLCRYVYRKWRKTHLT